jgi:hypothetical protein
LGGQGDLSRPPACLHSAEERACRVSLSDRTAHHRELIRLRASELRRVSTLRVGLSQPTDRYPTIAERRIGFRSCEPETTSSGPEQCAPRGATAHRCRFSNRPSTSVTVGTRESAAKSSRRDTNATASRSAPGRTVGSESLEALLGASEPPRSLRWCQRRHDHEHLGPGSRCSACGCAASLRRGGESPRMRQPPAVGRRSLSESRKPRQGLLPRASSKDEQCGAIAALTEECEQPEQALNGRLT